MKDLRGYALTGALVTLALLLLQSALKTDPRRRNVEIFTEMAYSRAAEAFAPSAVLPDGRTLQRPVEGVVVRGALPFRYGAGPEQAQRAGRELANPFALEDAAAVERGRVVFNIYCAVCHGADGQGLGPAVLRGVLPPPSFMADRARTIADGEMFHIVTRGQGNMPSYAFQIEAEDRWKAILQVRTLQRRADEVQAGQAGQAGQAEQEGAPR